MRGSLVVGLGLLAAAGAACAAPPAPSVTPSPAKVEEPPAPPWRRHISAADGWAPEEQASPTTAIVGATLLLGNGERIEGGTLVMTDGHVSAVGGSDTAVPQGALVVDGRGKFVTPGLIDTHSHMGVYPLPSAAAHRDGNEMTSPVTGGARTVDAFWPEDPALERAVAGGVTTIQVLPGSANLIGGRAVTIKLRGGRSAREMHVPGAPDGLKMACGENPKRVYGSDDRPPMTRMGNLAGQREAFRKALTLRDAWTRWRRAERVRLEKNATAKAKYAAEREQRRLRAAYCDEHDDARCDDWREKWATEPLQPPQPELGSPSPEGDDGTETLVAALEGKILVHIHCYRADDMLNMIALSEEVGFTIRSFHHALEAYKIRDELARRHIATSTWADWWGFKLEAYDGIPENAALVAEAGGRTIIHSDSWEGVQRLNQEAAKALASGQHAGVKLDEDDALRWITQNPAWALGIDAQTGTLEPGKAADVVLWDRSPFSVYATAERVWIDGAPRYDRTSDGPPRSDFELGQPARMPATSDFVPSPGRAR